MKSTLAVLFATVVLVGALGLPTLSAIRRDAGATADPALIEGRATYGSIFGAGDDEDDDSRKTSRRDKDEDDDDDDDGHDDDGDDDD